MHLRATWIPDQPFHRLFTLARPLIGAGFAEFLVFGAKEAAACVFAGSFLLLLGLSTHVSVPGLYRYDLLFLGGIAIQLFLMAARLESPREVVVLSLFHAIGVGLELFKTAPGIASWSYPEPAFFRLGTVPLYSGFMYSAVASYLMQAWRLLKVEMEDFPPTWVAIGISAAIYANFFTHHYIPDLRWILGAAILLLFRRSRVRFTVVAVERQMPLALSFTLIGFFVWVAENIATFFGAWSYPYQKEAWRIVGLGKISSWVLLIIVSFIIVAVLERGRTRATRLTPGGIGQRPRLT